MYYNIQVHVPEEHAFTFQWHSNVNNGWARLRTVLYAGGDSVTLSGSKIKVDGSTAYIDGRASAKLKDLPYPVLLLMETAISEGMQNMRRDLGRINGAILLNMPKENES